MKAPSDALQRVGQLSPFSPLLTTVRWGASGGFSMRTYTLERGLVNHWKLTLFEDGQEVGGGVGAESDYDSLLEVAHQFCETV